MYRHNRRRMYARKKGLPEITLTPLIDTALTLLIIFMVTTPMITNIITIELPKSNINEDHGVKQELIVFIDQREKIFFNNQAIHDNNELTTIIKQHIGHDTNRTIFVKADQSVKYGHVIELVDQIKMIGGIAYVALATQRA